MTSPTLSPAAVLESTWHEQIPLSRALQLRVSDFEADALETRAPLAPNINLHGTAFAGSLYAVCALTGWGYVWRLGRAHGWHGDIVLTRGEIDYRRPVRSEIVCAASTDSDAKAAFVEALANGRAGRCQVRCVIEDAERTAVEFSGAYHMRPGDCAARPR